MYAWPTALLFLGHLCIIVCYVSYEITNLVSSSLEEPEEIKGPRSITECVMRCQRKTKEGFYTNGNKCFCHSGVVENQGDTSGVSTKENELNNEDKSILVLHSYRLDFTLEIWLEWDGAAGSYEPYGQIYLNIGNFNVNQDVDMWNIAKLNYLSVPNKVSYFVSHSHTFQESEVFAYIGNITAHGNVWESDYGVDDHIATPNGDVFQMKEILNHYITRHYPGSGSYIEISLKVTKLY
ncbi:uncharacterized protein [Clytia hemisphaerica]|uniref:uncharacterized protein n=1 Tax=Clytia hemisphaerica TaxID=252671 RepID=UPI0034D79929